MGPGPSHDKLCQPAPPSAALAWPLLPPQTPAISKSYKLAAGVVPGLSGRRPKVSAGKTSGVFRFSVAHLGPPGQPLGAIRAGFQEELLPPESPREGSAPRHPFLRPQASQVGVALTLLRVRCLNEVVPTAPRQQLYRDLPSVEECLGRPTTRVWLETYPRGLVVEQIRIVLGELRRAIGAGEWDNGRPAGWGAFVADRIDQQVARRLAECRQLSLGRVINASGVILHTNLGRAPLSRQALEAIEQAAGGYSNLEYDLAAGRRGQRDVHAAALLEQLLGAPAVVVNNNAAAIFLVLNELAAGGEVVVSRGELIEIGDGFRIPDILARSGARLREVGATNRTRIEDFRQAVGTETRLLLRVHPSNFRIVGFTARPTLDELAALGRELQIPVVEDLGSGCLYDFSQHGFRDEPPVSHSLAAGVDLVTFSGDKLLGGPQAGIIAGRGELVRRVRRNPLFRALRVDKLTYAALAATLRDYLLERYDQIPVLRMVRQSPDEVRERAARLVRKLDAVAPGHLQLVEGESLLGGGSTPAQTLPTTLVALRPFPAAPLLELERRLRQADPPVVARVDNERLLLDLRTVSEAEDEPLTQALQAVLEAART